MPIVDQRADVVCDLVTATVDMLSDERTKQLLEQPLIQVVVAPTQQSQHDADEDGGDEPEIL